MPRGQPSFAYASFCANSFAQLSDLDFAIAFCQQSHAQGAPQLMPSTTKTKTPGPFSEGLRGGEQGGTLTLEISERASVIQAGGARLIAPRCAHYTHWPYLS